MAPIMTRQLTIKFVLNDRQNPPASSPTPNSTLPMAPRPASS